MGFTNAEQLREVFLSCGMGFLLGMLGDGLRAVRRYFSPPAVIVFAMDILYAATSAVTVFLFCLAMTQGQVRAYTLLAVFGGFTAYRLTVGKLTDRFTDAALAFITRTGDSCERLLDALICRLKRRLSVVFRELLKTVGKMRKKAKKFSKKTCNKDVE